MAFANTKAPALPFSPVQYDRQAADATNNILRQYFNQLDNLNVQVNELVASQQTMIWMGMDT